MRKPLSRHEIAFSGFFDDDAAEEAVGAESRRSFAASELVTLELSVFFAANGLVIVFDDEPGGELLPTLHHEVRILFGAFGQSVSQLRRLFAEGEHLFFKVRLLLKETIFHLTTRCE